MGVIFLVDAAVNYRRDTIPGFARGRLIVGVALIAVGLFFLFGTGTWWPVILIIIGLAFLLGSVWRR